jgi:heme exporter protein C
MEAARSAPLSAEMPAAGARTSTIALMALTILTIVGLIFGLYMGLVRAGTDIDQGNVQRIFYIHMPSFFGAMVAFGAAVVGGIMYLRTRKSKWDTLSLAGVEIGIALALVNLVTGSIWARPIWNTWWNWDPRLTADAIMILTYAAYLMLRSGIDNPDTRRRFAAVYGIIAFTSVLMVLIIPRIIPTTIHPVVIGPVFTSSELAQGGFELQATPGVGAALGINFIVWMFLLPITLLWHRIRLQNLADRVEALKTKALSS